MKQRIIYSLLVVWCIQVLTLSHIIAQQSMSAGKQVAIYSTTPTSTLPIMFRRVLAFRTI